MNTYDRHLLREWLSFLAIVLGGLVGMLLVNVLYGDMHTLRDVGAHGLDLWMYVLITVPSFLAIVLPLALLVSLIFVLGQLHRANEFTVLRAAGVGLARITVPIWVVGVAACGLTWWLNTSVVPWSVEESATMIDRLQFRKQSSDRLAADRVGAVYSVGFDNTGGGRVWFFDRYSQYTGRGYGVSVSVLDPRRREVSRILAAQAAFDVQRGWTFYDGRVLVFDPDNGKNYETQPFKQRVEPRFREDPKLMLLIDRKPVDLSILQLRRLIDYFAVQGNPKGVPYAVRYFELIADTFGPLIVIAIAIPFAMTGVRVNPAIGVAKSLGLYVLYYVLSNVALALATRQIVDPPVAAWVPNIGMTLLAVWLFVRMR